VAAASAAEAAAVVDTTDAEEPPPRSDIGVCRPPPYADEGRGDMPRSGCCCWEGGRAPWCPCPAPYSRGDGMMGSVGDAASR